MTLGGFFKNGEGDKFLLDLSNKLTTFNSSEYYVVVDTQEIIAVGQDSLVQIKKGIKMVASTSFKERYNIISKNSIANSQAQRVSNNDEFNKIIRVQSYSEVLKLITITEN